MRQWLCAKGEGSKYNSLQLPCVREDEAHPLHNTAFLQNPLGKLRGFSFARNLPLWWDNKRPYLPRLPTTDRNGYMGASRYYAQTEEDVNLEDRGANRNSGETIGMIIALLLLL